MEVSQKTEKWENYLISAKDKFKIADHMAYVSLSILKENRMLIRIVAKLAESVKDLIKAFLYHEYSLKKIRIYSDSSLNIETFIKKVAPRYVTKSDLNNLIKILKINKQHAEAPVEFVKKETFVILLGDKYETLNIASVREFLNSVRISIARFPKNEGITKHI